LDSSVTARRHNGGHGTTLADVSRAAERLGWKAEVSLEAGLSQLVSWWREQRAAGTAP